MYLTRLLLLVSLASYGQTMPHNDVELKKEHADSFEKLCSITLHNGVVVKKYRSRLTGMHVILAGVEGPIVSGYFTLATEAQDDDGLPHTLEHLVFLGSEEYPYKGILDLLANRCLASGTNAWTDTDHTAYTIETAGSEGFLNHLPIYLDHLLYPTLTDAAFMTEVYHVTGEGEDAGVVYSEMQSRENSGADRSFLALQRAFYPEPECGYRYETGGIMKNLRNTTTNERIRAYHREFYRPENLHLIITGQIDPSSLFDVLVKFEDKIISKGPLPPYTRPWQRPVAPLTESVRKDVVYPSNTHDTGRVLVAWRGPSASTDYRQLLSLTVLMEYLTYSSVSALPATFVEVDDPLASDVTHYVSENQASNCYLKFSGVPLEHMEKVEPAIHATLASLYAGTGVERIDLSELHEFIENLILTQHSELETSPRDTLAYAIIGDALYGSSCSDLEHRVDKVSWYRELLRRPLNFWLGLLKQYLLDMPAVVILARPSAAEALRLQQEDELRVELRKQELGVAGLKALEDQLLEAELFNEIPPPPEMLSVLPIPSPAHVVFHDVETYSNHPASDESRSTLSPDPPFFPLSQLPLRMQVDQINTKFVSLTAVLDSSSLSPERRLYLPLLLELFFESSVLKDGTTLMPYDTVVRRLSAEMVDYTAEMGLSISGTSRFSCGPFCNYVLLFMKFEWSRYSEGVAWLEDILYHLRPTISRLSIKADKLLNSIDDSTREASKILSLMHRGVIFDKESNKNQVNLVRQLNFLTELSHRLDDKTQAASVLEEVMEILTILCSPDNLSVHISANFTKLAETQDVAKPWRSFVDGKTFRRRAKPLHVIADSESRNFRGVIPLDIPQFQSPVRQIIEEIKRIPTTIAPSVHKSKKDLSVVGSVRSFGKSIGDVVDSENDLSEVTPKPDQDDESNINNTNHFFSINKDTNGSNNRRVIIIHSGSVVHHNSGGSMDTNIDSVLSSNGRREFTPNGGDVVISNSGSVVNSNTGSLHHDTGRIFGHPHPNTDTTLEFSSSSNDDASVSTTEDGMRTLSLMGSLKNSSTTLEVVGNVGIAKREPTAWVYGLPEADSGYLQQSAVSITQYTHWHLPALLTAIQYFTQLEGPMWREIRGRGLAYNYDLQLLPSDGLITFKLTRAAQLLEAYEESVSMLRGFINGSRDWDPLLLESAKSSLMFEVIYREDTVSDVVQQSLLAYYRKVPLSYNRDLLALIAGVSLEEARWAAQQYLTPLLLPSSSRTVVVCDPSEVDDTLAVLSSLGHTVEEVSSLSNNWFV